MSSERGSFIEKDIHSPASVADDDLRKCQDTLCNMCSKLRIQLAMPILAFFISHLFIIEFQIFWFKTNNEIKKYFKVSKLISCCGQRAFI